MGNLLGKKEEPSGGMSHIKPVKLSAWDGAGMKRTLDDNIAQIICNQTGLTPNNRSFDLKLFLMLAACATGCYAQFNPAQFPENKSTIVLCVIVYFIISSVYQAIVWFVDKDYVFVSKAKSGSTEVCLRTQMHKYSNTYTVTVEQPKGQQVASVPFSVGEFFTEDGQFSEGHFASCLQQRVSSIMAGQGKKSQ